MTLIERYRRREGRKERGNKEREREREKTWIMNILKTYLDIFKGNDSFWNIFSCVFKVVEASITENEPTSFPTFPTIKINYKFVSFYASEGIRVTD